MPQSDSSPRRLSRRSVLAATAAGIFAGAACARRSTEPLTIFAAASLARVMQAAAEEFEQLRRRETNCVFAGTAQLARQIEQGAPAHVFVAADDQWTDWLAERGLILRGSQRIVASNRLVLIAPVGAEEAALALNEGGLREMLTRDREGRIALALPEVPAGAYARQALDAHGLMAEVEDRIAPAENVRVALAYVAREEAALGVVYATDAAVEERVKVLYEFPATSHDPILYSAVAVAAGGVVHPETQAFVDYLAGPAGQAWFAGAGFLGAP